MKIGHSGVVRAFLFDLDGTLLNSFRDIVSAANYTLAALGRPMLPEQQVRSYIGNGPRSLLGCCLTATGGGGDDEAQLRRALEVLEPRYAAHCLDTSALYEGTRELLIELSGAQLAIVSNKPMRDCVRILDALELAGTFAAITGGDTHPERKPDPGPVLATLRRLGVAADEAVMVGDSTQDVIAGRAAGVRTVGVGWGLHGLDRLAQAGADRVVGSVPELRELLLGLVAR